MKTILTLFILIPALYTHAQNEPRYYDYEWKPCSVEDARFISIVNKTDSGWLRKDFYASINVLQFVGLFADDSTTIGNGSFAYFYPDGKLQQKGSRLNGRLNGTILSYHSNGMMSDSSVYENGSLVASAGWYSNGYSSDSSYRENGKLTEVYWYDDGTPSAAGRSYTGKKEGVWQYFHRNGSIASQEWYSDNRRVKRIYFDTTGARMEDTTDMAHDAEFPGGEKAWSKFVYKRLYFPSNYKIVNSNRVTVVVSAVINENGNAVDAYVSVPFMPEFDKIALDIFRKCPKWIPAFEHNRPRRQKITQVINFSQQEY